MLLFPSKLLGSTALTRLGTLGAGIALFGANAAVALPQNGQVVGGSATIAQTAPNQLDITQTSSRAVIDWQSFSIGAGEATNFHQPSANAIAFNRVTGVDPSQIMGRLTANGTVVLVNPNGILFGKGARVDVGGLVASTAGISNQNAMDGTMSFDQPGNANATINNQGAITAADGGLVALVAPGVANSGVITANLGKVSLASGNKWTMDMYGDHLVNFVVNDQVASKVIGVTNSGAVNAAGGKVELSANVAKGIVSNAINMTGIIEATSATTVGGVIILSAPNSGVAITGTADASGASGGTISVTGDSIVHQGMLDADGFVGNGGSVTMNAGSTYIDTANAVTSASGSAKGGSIAVSAGNSLYTSGHHKVTSSSSVGGSVTMTAPTTNLVGAAIDASGGAGGGSISIGGGPHGSGALAHASTTNVTGATTLTANAMQGGNGGTITIWSDEDTKFAGATYAKAGVAFGNGGQIEVSSAGNDLYAGTSDASAPMGSEGQLLLDPKNITVDSTTGIFPQFQFINPNPTLTGTFGSVTVALASGDIVITDPTATIGLGPAATGAAYLFNGMTGQLISTLTGSYAGDAVGSAVTKLTNGNYVVSETTWNGTRGAATLGNGTTGVSGAVAYGNSLVGFSVGDLVGTSVTALTNGNYVVGSSSWNGGVGAATWGSGSSGVTGNISSANSLIGSAITDHVGAFVTALSNGDYVVQSPAWNGTRGAASWGNGASGTTGIVSSSNSLVGSSVGDQAGLGVTALTNGNYVVDSPDWSGTRGAASWGNGTTGITGTIGSGNSLIGSLLGDEVGLVTTALTNGNYVVGSPDWSLGKGAATWGNGASGLNGTVTTGNSLTGTLTTDAVGLTVTALSNGNYVVGSPGWGLNKGAASWGNGASGLTGTISTANSLIGSTAADEVGLTVTALSNGNYVVGSPDWNLLKGAATFGSGTTGVHGTISSANSLIGSTASDEVGLAVTALTNGNYVVQSPLWGGTVGAATFASGTSGITGTISSANSLTGALINDEVGLHVTALPNGNYVIGSPDWDLTRGAATFASGTTGIDGTVSSANSLVGSLTGDLVGSSVTPLTMGNFVVGDFGWAGGLGAATYGTGALSGTVTPQNSIIGPGILGTPLVGVQSITPTGNFTASFGSAAPGTVFEGMTNISQLNYGSDQAGTITIAPSFITQTLNTGTAVVLQADNDITVNSPITASAGGNGGALTLQAGRSLIINGNITTDNGNLTLMDNDTGADGVVNADRNPGNATIAMAPGTTLNAGTGLVTITTLSGAGITNAASNGMTLNNVTGSAINVVDQMQGTLTLNGVLNATGSGTSMIISSGVLTNNDGSSALNAGTGRFLMYTADPTADTLNGISNYTKQYGASFSANPPSSVTAPGNIAFFSLVPTVTIDPNSLSRTYGSANPALSYTPVGLLAGDTIATALATAPTLTTSATSASNVGSYAISVANMLTSPIGYNIITNTGTLTVTPAALTITPVNTSRLYGAANPALSAVYNGLTNGDASSAVSGLSLATVATTASNVGSYAITAGNAMAANYTISYGPSGTLSVTQAPLTITPDNVSRIYGSANPVLSASYSGLVNGDTSTVVSNLSLSTPATSTSNAGTYAITAMGASATNYAIAYGPSGTMTIGQAPLTITANDASRLYGTFNPNFSATYSGLMNGDGSGVVSNLVLNTTATPLSNVGAYTITAGNGSATNYAISYYNGTLTINPAPLTITTGSASRVYGGANPALSATYSGFQNADTSSVVTGLTLSTTATSASNVGSYAITGSNASAGNYTISYVNGVLAITQAPLTITPVNANRLYGAANPAFSATYSGLVNNDASSVVSNLTLSTAATTASNVGNYAITATSGSALNYAISYGTGSILAIAPAPLTIAANNASRLYGAANPTFGATYNGLLNNDSSTVVSGLSLSSIATSASNVGAYAITATSGSATNYAIAYVNGTLLVTPAALTITANNSSRVYGSANPALSAAYIGLVNGDTSSVVSGLSLSTVAISASNVGTYAIAAGNGLAANYTISYINGVLSVTPAALTITAGNASRLYGTANPTFSASYNGLVNGDTSAAISGLTLSTSATTASSVGAYAITASGAMDSNYTITYGANGILTIAQAALTITAQNAARLYGSANPAFSASYSGLVNGDSSAVVSGLTLASATTTASNVGSYAITGGNASAANYAIAYTNGTLLVTPAPLTITASNASRSYGANNPVFSATYNGLVNGDASTVVSGLALATTATSASNVGLYAITSTGAMAQNYAIAYGPSGALSVTPAALTISANNSSRVYGAANPGFSASYNGLVNGDTSGAISGLSLTTTATTASSVGAYAIAAGGASDANYTITYGPNGTLSVTAAALTITAGNAARAYGSANPAFSASYSGLVNGDSSSAIINLSLTSNATTSSNVGSYAITGSGAIDANYTISYNPGTLLVTPAALTITSANSSRVYGAANPTFSASYNGLLNGDSSAVVGNLSLTVSATTSSNVGAYTITASGGSAMNYAITYNSAGTLTITPASLTITPDNSNRLYGANNLFTASFSGLVAGDSSTSISGLTLSSAATLSSNVGTYAISASGGADANYTIAYGPSATLSVTAAPLTITALDETRLPNTSVTLGANISGLVAGDTSAIISGLALSTTATQSSAIGDYPIVASGASAGNYMITYGPNATLHIVAALPVPSPPMPVSDPGVGPNRRSLSRMATVLLINGPLKNARFNTPDNIATTPVVFPVQFSQAISSTFSTSILPYIAYDEVDSDSDENLCLKVSFDSAGGTAGKTLDDSCAAPLALHGF